MPAEFVFRSFSDGTAEAVGTPDGVPEQIAQLLVTEAARQVSVPGLWQGVMTRAEDQTSIELSRLGDEDQAVAVVRARRSGGELELDSAHVDAGQYPAVATTESLASAAALELERLPDDRWHRLVLVLEHPRN